MHNISNVLDRGKSARTHTHTHTHTRTHAHTHAHAQHTRPCTRTTHPPVHTHVRTHPCTHSLTHAHTSSQVGVEGALTMVMSMAGHTGQSAAWAGCTAGAATACAPPALSTQGIYNQKQSFSCKNKQFKCALRCQGAVLILCLMLSQWNLHDFGGAWCTACMEYQKGCIFTPSRKGNELAGENIPLYITKR